MKRTLEQDAINQKIPKTQIDTGSLVLTDYKTALLSPFLDTFGPSSLLLLRQTCKHFYESINWGHVISALMRVAGVKERKGAVELSRIANDMLKWGFRKELMRLCHRAEGNGVFLWDSQETKTRDVYYDTLCLKMEATNAIHTKEVALDVDNYTELFALMGDPNDRQYVSPSDRIRDLLGRTPQNDTERRIVKLFNERANLVQRITERRIIKEALISYKNTIDMARKQSGTALIKWETMEIIALFFPDNPFLLILNPITRGVNPWQVREEPLRLYLHAKGHYYEYQCDQRGDDAKFALTNNDVTSRVTHGTTNYDGRLYEVSREVFRVFDEALPGIIQRDSCQGFLEQFERLDCIDHAPFAPGFCAIDATFNEKKGYWEGLCLSCCISGCGGNLMSRSQSTMRIVNVLVLTGILGTRFQCLCERESYVNCYQKSIMRRHPERVVPNSMDLLEARVYSIYKKLFGKIPDHPPRNVK